MAIALKQPRKLRSKNKGLVKMGPAALLEFAGTPEKGLPKAIKKPGKKVKLIRKTPR
jgi:hypothetical protein